MHQNLKLRAIAARVIDELDQTGTIAGHRARIMVVLPGWVARCPVFP